MAQGKSKYYVHPDYGHCYGDAIITPPGRLVFPALEKPKAPPPPKDGGKQGEPRYEAPIMFDKADPAVIAFFDGVKTMTDEMLVAYNEGKKAKIGQLELFYDCNKCVLEKYPFYRNMISINARNAKKFNLVDSNKQSIEPSAFAGGMKVRAVVTPMITATGVSYKATILQLLEDDGVRYAGGVNAERQAMALLDSPAGTATLVQEAPAEPATGVRTGKQSPLAML